MTYTPLPPRPVLIACPICPVDDALQVVESRQGRPRRFCDAHRWPSAAYYEWKRRTSRQPPRHCRGCSELIVDPGVGRQRATWCSEACRGRYRRRHGGSTRPTV